MTAVLRQKLIILDMYIREDGRLKISNLFPPSEARERRKFHLKEAEEKKNGENEIRNQWNSKQENNREKSIKPKAVSLEKKSIKMINLEAG